MAFREPDLIHIEGRVPPAGAFPVCTDKQSEVAELAKVWDARGLLYVVDSAYHDAHPFEAVKVFNCYKNLDVDRQIGDRRGRNYTEAKIVGPSVSFPCGPDLCSLYCNIACDRFAIGVTDRKDYYHQLKVTPSKAFYNAVGPPIPCNLVAETEGYKEYLERSRPRRYVREKQGDRLAPRSLLVDSPGHVRIAFKSVFQGDHAGVDFATCAHVNFLQSRGLLNDDSRIVSTAALQSRDLCQGFVIDDFFVISREKQGSDIHESVAAQKLEQARQAYEQEGILGRPEKDVLDFKAKVVGATVNTGDDAVKQGIALVSAPIEKRLALSAISLEAARLSHCTDALMVCLVGGWISALMYRRPMMSLFSQCFKAADMSEVDADNPKLIPLSRKVANELVLVSVLMPLIASEINAPWLDTVFCTDASNEKGAYCKAKVPEQLSEVVWKTTKSKGGYSRLLSPVETALRRVGQLEEEVGGNFEEARTPTEVPRPLAFVFDFIEVFAGAAKVTHFMRLRGFVCCQPIDLSNSSEHDLSDVRVMEWIAYLITNRRVKAFMVEPPCTTFSIMRRPALRSADEPYGFFPHEEKTHVGNVLSLRGLQMMHLGRWYEVPGIMECPYSSLVKRMPPYKTFLSHDEASCTRCDSCRYGSIHLKSFAFLGVHIDPCLISLRCQCRKRHVMVQGTYTKASATYVDDLAEALADTLANAVTAFESPGDDDVKVEGLENQIVNDLALCAPWEVGRHWNFRRKPHINILEAHALFRLVSDLSKLKTPCRLSAFLDSNVVRCAMAKGRTSSRGLSPLVCKVGALCVAAGLYVGLPFVPTRWNPSDAPTREKIWVGQQSSILEGEWSRDQLFRLAQLPKLKRWAANWVRLLLRMNGPAFLDLSDRSLFRLPPMSSHSLDFSVLDFDSTKGFPGEGPQVFCLACVGADGFRPRYFFPFQSWKWLQPFLVIFFCLPSPMVAMPMFPRNAGDSHRAQTRATRGALPFGRPVLHVTKKTRDELLNTFSLWLQEQGVDFSLLIKDAVQNIEDINVLLAKFGREMYAAGRPLNQYSETINALGSLKPAIRRSLQGAWDLAYAWVKQEPNVHHVAMPGPVLLAMISICFLWGWVRMAGILALGWGAILRSGELLKAKRSDLVLPSDSGYFVTYALLAISEPKTRFTTARHQSAKLDIPDLLRVVELAFSDLKQNEFLWNFQDRHWGLDSNHFARLWAYQIPCTEGSNP